MIKMPLPPAIGGISVIWALATGTVDLPRPNIAAKIATNNAPFT